MMRKCCRHLFQIWHSTQFICRPWDVPCESNWQIHFKLATSTFEHIISELHIAWIHCVRGRWRCKKSTKCRSTDLELLNCVEIFTLASYETDWKGKKHALSQQQQRRRSWNKPLHTAIDFIVFYRMWSERGVNKWPISRSNFVEYFDRVLWVFFWIFSLKFFSSK